MAELREVGLRAQQLGGLDRDAPMVILPGNGDSTPARDVDRSVSGRLVGRPFAEELPSTAPTPLVLSHAD